MSGIWHGCDGKRGTFYSPQTSKGKHCGRTFLLAGKPAECMGTITDIDGKPVCGECEARAQKAKLCRVSNQAWLRHDGNPCSRCGFQPQPIKPQ